MVHFCFEYVINYKMIYEVAIQAVTFKWLNILMVTRGK